MILKGEKVILRPLKLDDAPRFVKWLRDPEVNKFSTRKPVNLEEEKKWIRNLPKNKNIKRFSVVVDKSLVGSIGIEVLKDDKIGYVDILIGDKNEWGKGFGSDAMKTLLLYAFNKLNLNKVNLGGGTYSYNKRAINFYKRMGFKVEGVIREGVLYKGKFYDLILMGILQKEWKNK